jgi:hypothetical protein
VHPRKNLEFQLGAQMDQPLDYLLHCSKSSLESFRLSQLNKSANKDKLAREALNEVVEARALALLANWIELYGEGIVMGEIGKAA